MTGRDLPDSDNVVRYVGGSHIEDGQVLGGAFCLPPGRETLSVNWLECFAPLSRPEQLAAIRRLSRLTLGASGRLAELNAGAVKSYVAQQRPSLRLVSSPLPANENYAADPSHGDIIGLPPADSPQSTLIGDMIAECVNALHPARE